MSYSLAKLCNDNSVMLVMMIEHGRMTIVRDIIIMASSKGRNVIGILS